MGRAAGTATELSQRGRAFVRGASGGAAHAQIEVLLDREWNRRDAGIATMCPAMLEGQ